MQPIILEPTTGMSPFEMASTLEKGGLRPGSAVLIRRLGGLDEKAWTTLLLIALAAIEFASMLKRSHELGTHAEKAVDDAKSAELLDRLFKDIKDVEALEREVEGRSGVTIEIEEAEEWPTAGMYLLNRAYGDDEPDISGLTLKEPNPDYRP